jgi:hypothetical protein
MMTAAALPLSGKVSCIWLQCGQVGHVKKHLGTGLRRVSLFHTLTIYRVRDSAFC